MSKLYILCGCPGVGKSTVADMIADEVGATVFRTDEIRKELFPNPSYSKSESQRVYDELMERSEAELRSGTPVVMDATFNLKVGRDNAVEVADSAGVNYQILKVTCDEDQVRKRIKQRDGKSDADFSIYQKIRDSFEPIQRSYETIDNSGSEQSTRKSVRRAI